MFRMVTMNPGLTMNCVRMFQGQRCQNNDAKRDWMQLAFNISTLFIGLTKNVGV